MASGLDMNGSRNSVIVRPAAAGRKFSIDEPINASLSRPNKRPNVGLQKRMLPDSPSKISASVTLSKTTASGVGLAGAAQAGTVPETLCFPRS